MYYCKSSNVFGTANEYCTHYVTSATCTSTGSTEKHSVPKSSDSNWAYCTCAVVSNKKFLLFFYVPGTEVQGGRR
jgi:hypothetical protein